MAVVGTPVANLPTICWYQRRHHVKIAKQDESRSEINSDAIPCLGGGGPGDDDMTQLGIRDFGASPGTSWDVDCTGYDYLKITWDGLTFAAIDDIAFQVSTDGINFDGDGVGEENDYIRNQHNQTVAVRDTLSKALGSGAGVTSGHYGICEVANLSNASMRTLFSSESGVSGAFNAFTTVAFRDLAQAEIAIRISSFGGVNISAGVIRVVGRAVT